MLGGLSALNSAHPESLDLEIDAHPLTITALYLPHLSATAALQAWDTAGAGSPLLVWARVCIRRALKRCGLADSGTSTELGTLICGTRVACSSTCAADGQLCPHNRAPSVTDCTAMDRVTRLPPSAQVVCVLLDAPQLVDAPLRAIAASAGVSVGMAKETMDTLRTTGFFEHLGSRRRLVRTDELLDLWAAAYPGSGPGQQTPGRQW